MKYYIKHENDINNDLTLPGKTHYYEDLYAFEYTPDENVFQECIELWLSLLKSFFIEDDIDKEIVKKNLLPLKNSRHPPSPHSESILNFDQVKKALQEADPPLDYFLRM